MKLRSILFCASAMMLSQGVWGQYQYGHSIASTGGQKYILLEEGTGTWCGYCPDGAQRIQQTIEPSYPRCISVAFHNSDGMALSPDNFNADYISGSTATPPGPGWPGATIDRIAWTSPGVPGSTGACGQNRGYWSTEVGYQNSQTPKFDVRMVSTYDSTTRTITIKVTGKALVAGTGLWRINAYIIEDSISSATYPQGSYMNTSSGSWFMGYGSPISPASRYAHMGVVKKVLASGGSIYGDAAFSNPAVGDSMTKTYTYVIPASDTAKYTRVVGLVQKYNSSATNDRAIENVMYARVRNMWKTLPTTAIENTLPKISDVELLPNPAKTTLGVRFGLSSTSPVNISIVNALGQVVYAHEYKAGGSIFGESIDVSGLSNGTYFVNIANDGESVTKTLTIAK